MELKNLRGCLVQVFVDDVDRRTVSVTVPSVEFKAVADLLGYKVQAKGSTVFCEAPMTRDRLKLQFVIGEIHGE